MNDVIKSINVDGVEYDIQAKELTKVTYAELKELRDNGGLVAGHLYRITDYEFTTTQVETKSAGHVFDIIVLAVAENELSHIARAIAHEGDTYFDGNDLGAWELWYELDNDAEKYAWADAENGKGIIYRMIDEKRNDCPYDFKNALFYNKVLTTATTSDKYYYTFSYVVNGVLYDGTVEKQVKYCYGNNMGVTRTLLGKKEMNRNVFRNTGLSNVCNYNTFENFCRSNTFGETCYSNTFGDYCYSNTFGNSCDSNTFGDYCYSNTFGNSCSNNTFGTSSSNNNLGDTARSNTFGDFCDHNTFGDSCVSNTFGRKCNYNTFKHFCSSNNLGNNCKSNNFGFNCSSNTFESLCEANKFGNVCFGNTLGYSCSNNTFGDNVFNRTINSEKTSITINDEYFDDGSGQLVPVKHPDLSTQPSILPYKFMGQYVYEQLIPVSAMESYQGKFYIYKEDVRGICDNPVFLDCSFFGINGLNQWRVYPDDGSVTTIPGNLFIFEPISAINSSNINEKLIDGLIYARIVYTSMPEENGGYYYDNSASILPTKGLFVKHNGLIDITQTTWIEDNFGKKAFPVYQDNQIVVYDGFNSEMYLIGDFYLQGVNTQHIQFIKFGNKIVPKLTPELIYGSSVSEGDLVVSHGNDGVFGMIAPVINGGKSEVELLGSLPSDSGVLLVRASTSNNKKVVYNDANQSVSQGVNIDSFHNCNVFNIQYKANSSFEIEIQGLDDKIKISSALVHYYYDNAPVEKVPANINSSANALSVSNSGYNDSTWCLIEIDYNI